jgi:hypothetical protein
MVRDHDAFEGIVAGLKVCAEEMQNATGWSFYLGNLGMLQMMQGDPASARASLAECIEWARKSGSIVLYNGWQTALAYVLVDAPTDEASRAVHRRMIMLCRDDDDWSNTWIVLEAFAVHLAHNDRLEAATVLLAATTQAGRASLDFQAARVTIDERLRREPEFASWQARGAALTRNEAVDYALDMLGHSD